LNETGLKGVYNTIPKHPLINWLHGWIIPYYGDALLWNECKVGKPICVIKHIIKTSKADKDYARSYIVAEFKDFCFVSTHFALDNENNTMIANAILDDRLVQNCRFEEKPIYIAGDFNGFVNEFIDAGFVLCNDTTMFWDKTKDRNVFAHATKYDGSMIDLIYKYDPKSHNEMIDRGIARSFKPEWLAHNAKDKKEQKTKVSDHLPYDITVKMKKL
jgi:endonuclease/exonuclease/phosphatase family metal-dependent hydrolase